MRFPNVIRLLKPYRTHLIVGPSFKLTEAVLELLVPILIAFIVDKGIVEKNTRVIWQYGLLAFVLACAGLLCALICQYTASRASQGYGTDLRNLLADRIMRLSVDDAQQIGSSSLANRLITDTMTLQQAVAMLIRLVVRAPFLSVGALVMALLIDWRLASVFVLVIPLFIVVLYFIMSRSVPLHRKTLQQQDDMSAIMQENLQGMRIIRAYNRQELRAARFNSASSRLRDLAEQAGRLSGWLNPLTMLLLNIAVAAVLLLGGWRIDHGRLSQGQLIALINYLTQILQALIVVANLVMLYARAWNSAGRTEEILGMTVAASEVEGDFTTSENTTENSQQNSVAFAGVDFSYPRSTGVFIEQLSFKLEPGSVNGLIGPAGSGKSTIARLLVRLYEPVLGRIMLGDRAVDEFSAAELSSLIGYVPQNPSLMTGTIEENLRMGRDAFSEDDLWHALRLAQADGFVRELNDGLNSQVTRGGRNFSGGQRQRLAIARAILGRPRVIILDDSTSALDYATDLALRRALMSDEFLKSSTWIIISQRIANIRDADNILLLDDGALLASGTHEELMSGSDMYRELFHSQLDTRQHEEEADND